MAAKKIKKSTKREDYRNYAIILFAVLLIFAISSNIAWLNPRPGFTPLAKISNSTPFLWQYNYDSLLEIKTAAFFPEEYKTNPIRINRPTYPLIVRTLGLPFIPLFSLMTSLEQGQIKIAAGVVGYVILKLFIYSLGSIFLYILLKKFISPEFSLFAVVLVLFHKFSIINIATYHTTDLMLITPIIIAYFFYNLCKRYSHEKNIFYSLIIGILLLGRENYASYLAVILTAFYFRKFKESIISIMSHTIPLIAWLIFLKFYGLQYYNHELSNGHGIWLYKDFIYYPLLEMGKEVLLSVQHFIENMFTFYYIWAILAIIGVYSYSKHKDSIKDIKPTIILFCMLLFTTWLQIFASKRYLTYMTADIAILIFGFSAFAAHSIIKRLNNKWINTHQNSILMAIVFLWFIFNLFLIVHLPWVHPIYQGA